MTGGVNMNVTASSKSHSSSVLDQMRNQKTKQSYSTRYMTGFWGLE